MRRNEIKVDESLAPDDMQQGKCQRGIAAREGLQMNVGLQGRGSANRIHHHHCAASFRQPVLVSMRRRRMRIGPPHHDASGIPRRARIEAVERRAVQVTQGHVTGHIADGIRRDLRRPHAI